MDPLPDFLRASPNCCADDIGDLPSMSLSTLSLKLLPFGLLMLMTGRTLSFCSSAMTLLILMSGSGSVKNGPDTYPFSTHAASVSVNSAAHFIIEGAFFTFAPGKTASWYAGAPWDKMFKDFSAPSHSCIVILGLAWWINSANLTTFMAVVGFTGSSLEGNVSQKLGSADP